MSMRGLLEEFKTFINRGNLVDLAVAVLLATAFAPVVAAIVDGVFMNLIAAIFGEPDFSAIRLKIRGNDADGTSTYLEFGAVITAVVQFLIVALVCFFVVKGYNAARRTADEEEAAPTEVELLTEIRDALRSR